MAYLLHWLLAVPFSLGGLLVFLSNLTGPRGTGTPQLARVPLIRVPLTRR